jgi:hypothetical protein
VDSKWPGRKPVIALLLLAPVISEVLYGATRLSYLFVLVPEIGVWGCGALIIRYTARRWRLGWSGILLLGIALAVAEECIIQQTSLAPLSGLAMAEYGRFWGVNWVYLIWALGYESVWVVLVPVQLVDLMFASRRDEPWLGMGGLIRAAAFFSIASFLAWFMWTQRARTQVFHMPPYNPPLAYIFLAVISIAALILTAYGLRGPRQPNRGTVPRPAIVGLVVCLLGLPWGALVLVAYGVAPRIPFEWVIAASLIWAALSFLLMHRWSLTRAWHDAHRFAAVCGAIAACVFAGYIVFTVGGGLRADWIAKVVMDSIVAVLLGRFALSRMGRWA